jgi:hypothetical protein
MIRDKATTSDRKTRHGEFIERELKRLRHKPYVKVGILAENFSDPKKVGQDSKGRPATLGEVAVWNEFGTSDGRVPERSFIRHPYDHKRAEWIRRTNTLRKRLMAGEIDTEKALGLMGEMIQQAFKDRILSNIQPANAPRTIEGKIRDGNVGDKTLINFGQLLGSIHWSRHDGNH